MSASLFSGGERSREAGSEEGNAAPVGLECAFILLGCWVATYLRDDGECKSPPRDRACVEGNATRRVTGRYLTRFLGGEREGTGFECFGDR